MIFVISMKPVPDQKPAPKYVSISITPEADKALEIAAVYARVYKSVLPTRLARCPVCGVLLLHEDGDIVKCPACGRRYRLVQI